MITNLSRQSRYLRATIATRLVQLADIQHGHCVLDVCTGFGFTAILAAHRVGPLGSVLAIDTDQSALDQLTAIAIQRGLHWLYTRCQSADEPLPTTACDRILCSLGIMYLTSPRRALARWRAALRPLGKLALSYWLPSGPNPQWNEMSRVLFRHLKPEHHAPITTDSDSFYKRLLTETGFSVSSEDTVEYVLHYDSPETLIDVLLQRELSWLPRFGYTATDIGLLRRDLIETCHRLNLWMEVARARILVATLNTCHQPGQQQ